MALRIRIIIGVLIIVMLLFIFNMLRKKLIDLRYALGWLCLGVVTLVLDIFPQILSWCARLMGIVLPSNMVFMVGVLFLVIVSYFLTIAVGRMSDKTKRLTQEIALMREEMERMKK